MVTSRQFCQTTYQDNISIAANAADCARGGGRELLLLLTLILLLSGLVAFVRTGVTLGLFIVGHHVNETLKRWAEFTLLVFFEAIVQSFVDHDAQ